MSKKGQNIAIWTLVAASAGYVVGVLTAPKSGRETRKDIKRTASKAKTEAEKKIKELHSDLKELIEKVNKKKTKASAKVQKEMKQAVEGAKEAKEKARELLSALHDGDADDPDLKKAIRELTEAKENLENFLKK